MTPQNFQKHVKDFYASDQFRAAEAQASRFFTEAKDFLFGRPANLMNAVRTLNLNIRFI